MSAARKRLLYGNAGEDLENTENIPPVSQKRITPLTIDAHTQTDSQPDTASSPLQQSQTPKTAPNVQLKPKKLWPNPPKVSIDPISIARFHDDEISSDEEEEDSEESETDEELDDDGDLANQNGDIIPKEFENLASIAQYTPGANLEFPWDDAGTFWSSPDVLDSSPAFFFRLYKHQLQKKWLMVMKRDNEGGNPSIFKWRASLARTFLKKVLIPLGKTIQKEPSAKVVGEQKFWHPDWTVFFKCSSTKRLKKEGIYVKPYSFRGKVGVVVRIFQENERPLERTLENGEKYIQYGSFATLNLNEYYLMCSKIAVLLKRYSAIQADIRKRRQAKTLQPAPAA